MVKYADWRLRGVKFWTTTSEFRGDNESWLAKSVCYWQNHDIDNVDNEGFDEELYYDERVGSW